MIEQKTKERYMKMAISFAMRGTGTVSPNPKAGCVLIDESVEGGRLISWGYHRRFGGPHAAVEALRKAGSGARGCTAYVNIEPCYYGNKTLPCCDELIRAGVAKVIVGMKDPNPQVSGKGLASLANAGIQIETGVLEDECRWINRGFVRVMTMGRPWVTVKASVSADGRMKLDGAESGWIAGIESRNRARLLRGESDAIMFGVGAVLRDGAGLAAKDTDGRSLVKVIVDSDLSTPEESRVLDEGKCVFFTGPSPDENKVQALTRKGAKVIKQTEEAGAYIPMKGLLSELVSMGINWLMVQGGSKLIGSLIKSGYVDEFSLFAAPRMLGSGIDITDGMAFSHMDDAVSMKNIRIRKIGDDIWFEGAPSCSPAL
jgi:diaminohydroxyphosphoribosylaminopyrimidine deaminase/5-amino-6-(5-phosphoribosylamino)uracil reductase